MIYLIFNIFISFNVYGQMPEDVYQTHNILKLMNQVFVNKMVQLKQNLVEESQNNYTKFYESNRTLICPSGSNVLPRQAAVEIKYFKNGNENLLIEEVQFYGCNQKINFSVEVIREGDNIKPIGYHLLKSFDFDFRIAENEKMREYNIKIPSGVILKVYQENKLNVKLSEFYFAGIKIFNLEERMRDKKIEIEYNLFPYKIDFTHNQSRNRYQVINAAPTMTVIYKTETRSLEFFDYNRQPISLAFYQKTFNEDLLSHLIELNTLLFNTIDLEMPKTQFVNSGMTNARLVEELRFVQALLLSNTQLNVVQNYIQEYIKAAQEGQIEDRRPRKGK